MTSRKSLVDVMDNNSTKRFKKLIAMTIPVIGLSAAIYSVGLVGMMRIFHANIYRMLSQTYGFAAHIEYTSISAALLDKVFCVVALCGFACSVVSVTLMFAIKRIFKLEEEKQKVYNEKKKI